MATFKKCLFLLMLTGCTKAQILTNVDDGKVVYVSEFQAVTVRLRVREPGHWQIGDYEMRRVEKPIGWIPGDEVIDTYSFIAQKSQEKEFQLYEGKEKKGTWKCIVVVK